MDYTMTTVREIFAPARDTHSTQLYMVNTVLR